MENLEEMDNFSERYQVLKLIQDQIKGPNHPISPKEIESIINSLTAKKIPGPDLFNAEFYQIFKEDLIPIERKEHYPIHSMKP